MAEAIHAPELLARTVPMILARHGQAWLVGGWVRDYLLGVETHDIDFVVPGGAVATARQLATAVGGAFVLLDEERDTARVLVGQPWEALYLDVAGLRAPDIEQDLLERDFTVNAMAVPVAEWRVPAAALIDPTGGRVDLERRMLRAVSEESFRADPLRLLRAVRLSAALAFDLESQTVSWLRRDAALVALAARERVRDEFVQILALPQAAHWVRQMEHLGLLQQVAPELVSLRTVQVPEAGMTGLEQALLTLSSLEMLEDGLTADAWASLGWPYEVLGGALEPFRQRLVGHLATVVPGGQRIGVLLRLAALCHNLGRTALASAGARVLEQEVLGASMAATFMRRLCFATVAITRVRLAIQCYARLLPLALQVEGEPSPRMIYRFFRDAEPGGVDSILLALADHLASAAQAPERAPWQRHVDCSARLLRACYEQRAQVIDPPALVNGNELMTALGLAPGPEIGALLDSLRELQAAGEIGSRQEALAAARALVARGSLL